MAYRSRPWDLYGKQPPPPASRCLWLLLSLQLALILLGSFYASSSVLRRANHLGRHCSPVGIFDAASSSKPRLRIAMVSLSEEKKSANGRRSFEGLTEVVWRNKRAYTEKRGYDFIDASDLIDRSRPTSWSKILAVQSVLSRYDWVLWNDADTLVTNSSISLENILGAVIEDAEFEKSPDLVLTEDVTGVNAGIFFVRRSNWSVNFLDTWWNQTSFIRFGSSKSGDNDALKYLMRVLPKEELQEHVRISPMQCLFNSYPWVPSWKTAYRLFTSPSTIWKGTYSYGDFMVHLAGLDEKRRWADEILQEIEDNDSEPRYSFLQGFYGSPCRS